MDSSLLKKMHYKGGQAQVFNAPEGYLLGIESSSEEQADYQFVQLFVRDAKEVEMWLPKIIAMLAPDAVFWITYPKKSSNMKTDIHRDILASMVEAATDYQVVSNVSIDTTWSALRLREKVKVKSKF